MNAQAERTRIVIVDDHTLVRDGLRQILHTQGDMEVVGEAGDSASAVAVTAREQPDVVLLDIEIPGDAAAATIRQIRSSSPGSQILVLSMYEGPQLVHTLLAEGIRGYLLKSVQWQELVVAIRAIRSGRNRVILGVSPDSLGHADRGAAPVTLSAREREVLDLVAQALSNSQIATRLGLTEATVKRHLRNIFVKLDAVSRLDAVNKAADITRRSPASS